MNNLISDLPSNVLVQFPTGLWGFRGSVRVDLAYVRPDGSTPTRDEFYKAAKFGPRLAGLCTRTWDTKEAAMAAISATA